MIKLSKSTYRGLAVFIGLIVLDILENVLRKKVKFGVGLIIAGIAGAITAIVAVKLSDYLYDKHSK